MACLCGDTQCPSCGPAQGNSRCPICGEWADDGCQHRDEGGNMLPAFQAQADQIEADLAAAEALIPADIPDYWEEGGK